MKINTVPLLAVAVVVGVLATGCGTSASAPEQNEPKAVNQTDHQTESAEVVAEPEKVYLKKEYYEGSMIEPEQIDLLNRLFSAQQADDTQAYAALFTQDAPEADKQISFKVDKAENFSLFRFDLDPTGIDPLGGAIRENAADGYHSILYTLKQEAGQWRVAGIERADGPFVDEERYADDELEIVKLINASTKTQIAGDADAYRKLFIPNSNSGVLGADAPPIEELQIMDMQPPSADTAIVHVHYRVEGEKNIRSNAYAFVRQEGKWMIYDID